MPRRYKNSLTPHSGSERAIHPAGEGPSHPRTVSAEKIQPILDAQVALGRATMSLSNVSAAKADPESLKIFAASVEIIYARKGSTGAEEFEKRFKLKVADLIADTAEGRVARQGFFGDRRTRMAFHTQTDAIVRAKRDELNDAKVPPIRRVDRAPKG